MLHKLRNTEVKKAQTIAKLLNNNNELTRKYDADAIRAEANNYFIFEMNNTVVGAVEIKKVTYALSEIRHLVVDKRFRGRYIATMLILWALINSPTPLVYATVREDNIASQKTFYKCGFTSSTKYTTQNRDVIMFTATAPTWKRRVPMIIQVENTC